MSIQLSAPQTTPLYLLDAYRTRFTARVVSVDPAIGGIILDQTAFYPGGGGQPCDRGTLRDGVTTWNVTGARKEGNLLTHLVDIPPGAAAPTAGSTVEGRVDWPHRYRLMRTHTALHVLCGVVFRDYGALVTGGNMGPDKARMDFEMDSAEFTPTRVAEIEVNANIEIAAGREIRVKNLPRAEAFAIPDLIRTKINLLPEGITEIRTVELVGLDLQADGGTHVANTREVGGLCVIGTRSKGKSNKRLEIELIDSDVTEMREREPSTRIGENNGAN
ncbi:MAG: alanyl-tRNA editing protein [Chloroflexota bacterium]|nr:alanyl-tRNA editing protein [Chloroflexota bacterium]